MADNKTSEPVPANWLAEVYPDPANLFALWLKPLGEIKDNCIVVLDTNVLLTPYTIGPKSLDQIRATYGRLVKEKRLRVPAQVAREFVKNRAQKMEELFQQLTRKNSGLPRLASGTYPLLEPIESYKKIIEQEKALDAQLAKYREALGALIEHVRGWTWNDPVSSLYAEVFHAGIIVDHKLDTTAVELELTRRSTYRIPPGYKDASKPDAGVGDLAIWLSILELARTAKRHLLFVSGDEKSDWWHRSEGQALYPRFELAEEYRRVSGGASFHIARFSTMLDVFGAAPGVVEEVRQEEVELLAPVARPRDLHQEMRIITRAVARWARRRYSALSMSVDNPEGPAILIRDSDDENVGIEVMRARGAGVGMSIARLKDLAFRGHWLRDKHILTVFAVAVVAETPVVAKHIIDALKRRSVDMPEVHVHVGVLATPHDFVELEEVRLG